MFEEKSKIDKSFNEDFQYKHRNPYHERLSDFSDFVLRDHEGEAFKGKWNSNIFKREGKLTLEIGSGYGHFMQEYCKNNPEINYVGMDYRFKRSFQLARKLEKNSSQNFRYLRAKGERLEYLFSENELDTIFYFFPDPWPKSRHHKKRLFQKTFLEAAWKTLKPEGKFFIKTDHNELAEWFLEELHKTPLFNIEFFTRDLYEEAPNHFLAQFQTKFEKIFLKQEVKIKAFCLLPK